MLTLSLQWGQPKDPNNRTMKRRIGKGSSAVEKWPVILTGQLGDTMSLLGQMNNLTAYLDNSAAFEEYLNKQNIDVHLQKYGLQRRRIHHIMPPVFAFID